MHHGVFNSYATSRTWCLEKHICEHSYMLPPPVRRLQLHVNQNKLFLMSRDKWKWKLVEFTVYCKNVFNLLLWLFKCYSLHHLLWLFRNRWFPFPAAVSSLFGENLWCPQGPGADAAPSCRARSGVQPLCSLLWLYICASAPRGFQKCL